MITAVDTNIFLDILLPNEELYHYAVDALQESACEGSLVICDIVYAELCIHFENQDDCDTFLATVDVRVQALTREGALYRQPNMENLPEAGRQAHKNPRGLLCRRSRAKTSYPPAFTRSRFLPEALSLVKALRSDGSE